MTSQVRVLAYRLIRVVRLTAVAIIKIGYVKAIRGRSRIIRRSISKNSIQILFDFLDVLIRFQGSLEYLRQKIRNILINSADT